MRVALAAGEPERMALALGLEVGYRSLAGEPSWAFGEALRARGLAIAEARKAPQLAGFIQTTSGLAACLSGRFDVALERLVDGARTLRDLTVGHRFQIDIAEIMRIGSLLYLGRIREMSKLLTILVREAEESGDVCALRGLRSWRGNIAWLLQDQPDVAQRNLAAATTPRGPKEVFNLHHYYELLSRTQLDLYTGAIDSAAARMKAEWNQLEHSLLLRIQSVRIEGQHLRGRLALAIARRRPGSSDERRKEVDFTRKMAKRIEKENVPWGNALAKLLRAGAANVSGEADEAKRELREAIDLCATVKMALYGNVARRSLGLLVGGDEGRALVADAETWMSAEGIRKPEAVCALMAPGCTPD